jgi:hypothetical protein
MLHATVILTWIASLMLTRRRDGVRVVSFPARCHYLPDGSGWLCARTAHHQPIKLRHRNALEIL